MNFTLDGNNGRANKDTTGEMQSDTRSQHMMDSKKDPTVLCLLDSVFGNMTIHYSSTRIVHPRQGFEDILEIVREEQLISHSTKLVYLLVGQADVLTSSGSVIRSVEKLLDGLAKIQPRIMIVIGAILLDPSDTIAARANILEINQKLGRLAEQDHHWSFFNPNVCITVAGEPQKHFFDRENRINKAGCRLVAQALVATSKSARMLQKFSLLPPK